MNEILKKLFSMHDLEYREFHVARIEEVLKN